MYAGLNSELRRPPDLLSFLEDGTERLSSFIGKGISPLLWLFRDHFTTMSKLFG